MACSRLLTFHHAGDWGHGDVVVEWVGEGRRRVAEVEETIEQTWAAATGDKSVHLFDGPMCRLERAEVTDGGRRLRLSLSHTSYKPFFGTNLRHPELAARFGTDVMANPLGVSPALETADAFLLLGRRNDRVAYYPNRVHPFAGALEARDGADVFAAVRRELDEELHLSPADVPELRCTGLVEDAALRQPELVFAARSVLTRQEIARRLDPTEHRETVATPAQGQAIAGAIGDPALTPVAVASLLLWGRLRLGEEWYRRMKTMSDE